MTKKTFKELVKPSVGRPMHGKEPKRGKNLSLDPAVIAWIEVNGKSAKVNQILLDYIDKQNFDSEG